MSSIADLEGHTLTPLSELLAEADLPEGVLDAVEGITELLDRLLVADAGVDMVEGGFRFRLTIALTDEMVLAIPGLNSVKLVVGGYGGITVFQLEGALGSNPTTSPFRIAIRDVPLTLRVDGQLLRPLKPNTDEVDSDAKALDIVCGKVDLVLTERGLEFELASTLSVPRCMIGSTGILLNVGSARWLTPASDNLAVNVPDGFTGLAFDDVKVDLSALGVGALTMNDVFMGTNGFGGIVNWTDSTLSWNGAAASFSGILTSDIFGFKGGLSRVSLEFRQSALTACDITGCVFIPYIERVIGLSLGLDGNEGLSAIVRVPTCHFVDPTDAAAPGPAGYIITAKTDAFTLDINRVEFQASRGRPASVTLSGRAKLEIPFDLPAVDFKGLRIDTNGHVSVEGGWLDVETAKSSSLKGFPFQITKIGFGAEDDDRLWIGLNGGIKLADGLPIGASVEGLRVVWNRNRPGDIKFSLEGIGVKLRVPGAFSFSGQVAFFKPENGASGFRGSIKLDLETVGLNIDSSMMVGRTDDGTSFFFLFLDLELPAGAPLFSTGAAIYGFAGLLATNLRPSRSEGEDWYYGYYLRPTVGVTDSSKWSIQRDAFAIGLGTTVGSLPDLGFSFSAKALLVLVLPGPQLLLQGKGKFINIKPKQKEPSSEGDFKALLVLDVPAKLFQANLDAEVKIPLLIEIAGGVNVAFSWASNPPPDLWHVYLGEKKPEERRIHAKLYSLLEGDAWLMVNRPGTLSELPDRKGEFEIGGSLGIDLDFDFTIAKAWLKASITGEAAISENPQQFTGSLALKGSAGVSSLGLSCIADLHAAAEAKAPTPWYLAIDIEVGIKIDLLVFKWEFHTKLPLEFGDKNKPLPEPVSNYTSISADHLKADEAYPLDGPLASAPNVRPIVPPDVRPIVLFSRPVQDLAQFGAPGRHDLPPEDLGLRKVSYSLRHIVLLASDSSGLRVIGAAGEVEVSGNNVKFPGLNARVEDRLPDISGSTISFFKPGEEPTTPPFIVSAGSGDSATLAGTSMPPQGKLSYRLRAPRPSFNVLISDVGNDDATSGEVKVRLASPITNPSTFRGGNLLMGSASWLVLEAASTTTVRIRIGNTLPTLGAATLLGPEPPALEGQWAPTGEPVTSPESSTRLQVWARTPFVFYRHNELNSILGLDSFKPGYACGPEVVEKPICTQFEDVKSGRLTGAFSTAGVSATADGFVKVVPAGSSSLSSTSSISTSSSVSAQRLELGDWASGRGQGAVTFTFDPPVDAVWLTGEVREAGFVRALRKKVETARVPLDIKPGRYQFTGGIDQIEVSSTIGAIYELCFLPGWTCTHFDAGSFPQGQTGEVRYNGLTLISGGTMTVVGESLEVVPPTAQPLASVITDDARNAPRAHISTRESTRHRDSTTASASTQPVRADFTAGSPVQERNKPITLPILGLVEPALVDMPALGPVRLVPGLSPLPSIPGVSGGLTPGGSPPPEAIITVGPTTMLGRDEDEDEDPRGRELVRTGRVWLTGKKVRLAILAIRFPQSVTRVRISLARSADVVAFAESREVCRSKGEAGSVVSLYADPAAVGGAGAGAGAGASAAVHIGWIDRILVISPLKVRVSEVCIDAGDLGRARHEQWKWSQGVQRSIESLYRTDPVLPPGDYEMRVHTVAVVTGVEPDEKPETTTAAFTVGLPPGFPTPPPPPTTGVDDRSPKYPYGGPLTQLATYVERTMPAPGAALWYRSYDTAVGFNEAYLTRMYLDAGHELRVSVVNASGIAIRSGVRHVWSGTDSELDSWSTQYIRTLIGDGGGNSSSCATVDLDKIVKPEQVTAGSGEPLEPSRLHASELRSATDPSKVLHRFEFATSRYVNFRHHLATFDGRCRRLASDPAGTVSSVPPRAKAGTLGSLLSDDLATAISSARTLKTKTSSPNASAADLDAAKAAIAALVELRIDFKTQTTLAFDELWRSCFGLQKPMGLPSAVRLSVVRALAAAATQGSDTDVLLLESPEPIAWDRVSIAAASDTTNIPLAKARTTFAPDFGRPDAGFEVEYGGIRWLAGVELWVLDGQIRARAAPAVPLDVTLTVDQAVSIELLLQIDDPNGRAIISTDPPQPGGPISRGPSSAPIAVTLTPPTSGSLLKTAQIQGDGVGILSCSVIRAFMPVPPHGPLRITESRLPTASAPLDHEIVVMAMETVKLEVYTLRWIDSKVPEASQLYVSLPHIILREGQRLRLVPGRASSPVLDDAQVSAGGAVTTPPTSGAIFQLVDPIGAIIHEYAAMPVGHQSVIPVNSNSLTAFPNDDGTRAFLVPPLTAHGIGRGYWVVFFQFAGDAGPDLDRWSVSGLPVNEKAKLTFTII
jgi:hypothetical protein